MDQFTVHVGTAVPLKSSNVDTDQIIPAEYLKRITRTGFADGLFAAWRDNPDFVLNQEQHKDGTVLIAGPDFGTGSSREHAVWALQDHGFRVVVSSRFADIFRSNAGKNGLLPAIVEQSIVEQMWELVSTQPDLPVTVDLEVQQIRVGDLVARFEVDAHVRWRLLEGLDDIAITMEHQQEIADFEAKRPDFLPTTV
jgi:3-isopropylmalate/(R)-2-methylmalate dehydratase small subunit